MILIALFHLKHFLIMNLHHRYVLCSLTTLHKFIHSFIHSFVHSFIHSFIHQWLYSPLLGPDLFFSSVMFSTQTVGLLGQVISPSQGRYLHTDIHTLSGIRTHDPSIRASEDSSCLRHRGHWDRFLFE
jgi:hypothetical protein